MNLVLWAAQVVLVIKFLSVTYTHGFRPEEPKMRVGKGSLSGFGRRLLPLVALGALLGGLAVVLPAATGILAWVTPWAAAGLAGMMLVGLAFHVACRESPRPLVAVVLVVLAAIVAYGRWVLAPIG